MNPGIPRQVVRGVTAGSHVREERKEGSLFLALAVAPKEALEVMCVDCMEFSSYAIIPSRAAVFPPFAYSICLEDSRVGGLRML